MRKPSFISSIFW